MQVNFNGTPCKTAATTLEGFLDENGFGGSVVATAVNGNFVPKGARTGLALSENDKIEVLAPMQGG